MIFFNQINLETNSPNNILEIIHSELKYDLNEERKKIAFIAKSNWDLDASKMNRVLYTSIPLLDLEELIQTAQKISESYNYH